MSPKLKRIAATGISTGIIGLTVASNFSFAAGNLFPSEYAGLSDVDAFIRGLIRVIFIIATLAVLVYLIYGGFKWVTSGGDKTKTEEARNTITAAIIGLAIIALSFVVVTLLSAFFDINILEGNIEERIRNARQ
jgi:amino acid transporter